MPWQEPKRDWVPGDGIKSLDMNRIEDDMFFMYYQARIINIHAINVAYPNNYVQGLQRVASGYVSVSPGRTLYLLSVNGYATVNGAEAPASISTEIGSTKSSHRFYTPWDSTGAVYSPRTFACGFNVGGNQTLYINDTNATVVPDISLYVNGIWIYDDTPTISVNLNVRFAVL